MVTIPSHGGANGMVLLSSNSWMPSPSAAGEFFFLITAGCCEYIMGSDRKPSF